MIKAAWSPHFSAKTAAMREEQIIPGKGGEIDQRDVFLRHAGSTQLIDVRLPDIEEIFAIFARHEQALRLHSVWTDSVNDLLTDLEMLRIDRRANGTRRSFGSVP